MTLRVKLVLALVVLAVTATISIGVSSYVTTRRQLDAAIDRSLDDAARTLRQLRDVNDPRFPRLGPGLRPLDRAVLAFEQIVVQVIDGDGEVLLAPRRGELPVGAAEIAVASGSSTTAVRRDVRLDGESFRVLTVPAELGAVQVARSTAENDAVLQAIRRRTVVSVVLVAAAAGLVGWVLGHRLTRRLGRVAAAAGTVASTGRLDVEVPVEGSDEAARLGRAFSEMLAALASSREEQQRLVQDAGHELRTPLTSLRTNVSVLRRFEGIDPETRDRVLADLDSESRELTDLVNELVELATDRRAAEKVQPVVLGELVERVVARVRRRSGRDISVEHDGTTVEVRPAAVERAVLNLVENAVKFAPDGPVEVTVRGGRVEVRDHGPGIRDGDLGHVFERFYRSAEARALPGSGLGLAIVKSVAESHGGTVSARNAPDGGAVVGVTFSGD